MPRLGMTARDLEERALFVRRDIVALLARSQSGHSGGPLSTTDFGTVLFFHEMNVNPSRLDDPNRDMWHFSIGHVTPVIYSLMGERGYFPLVDLLGFRQFHGHLQGHPSKHDTPGIEVSSGSLGQGLSVSCGMALASRMDANTRRVYRVMGIAPLADKWRAFNWHVVTCDGHDIASVIQAFDEARRTKGKPTVILAKT